MKTKSSEWKMMEGKTGKQPRMNGKICTVRLIASMGQIHLEESGLALISGADKYEVIELKEKSRISRDFSLTNGYGGYFLSH